MIFSRFVAARATRTALIAASVPELTKRTRSSAGMNCLTRSPSSTSSGLGAPTALNARTGLSTPPGGIFRAREKSRVDLEVRLANRSCSLARVVSDDDVRAGPADSCERLEHRAMLVDPAVLCRRLQHRVFAAHVVRGRRIAERFLDAHDHIEIVHRRLHEHDVGAFFDVLLDLAE